MDNVPTYTIPSTPDSDIINAWLGVEEKVRFTTYMYVGAYIEIDTMQLSIPCW